MRVFKGVENLPKFINPVLTIGTFDGVHSGHQEIIHRINELAVNNNGESIILTFHPHPRQVLNPSDSSLKLLNSLEEKIDLLSKYGVDNLIIVPFSDAFSQQTPQAYVKDFLWQKIHPQIIVIGYDHRFGKDRGGDITVLKQMGNELGFKVEEIEAQQIENIAVSSTKIRNTLLAGDLQTANSLLGHAYTLSGKVEHGEELGSKLGYPTANLMIRDQNKLIPADGVYAVLAKVGESNYKGMMNIGMRPTFNGKNRTVETHIFDFAHDIYGKELSVDLIAYIRPELKFNSADALVAQMADDKKQTLKILSTIKK